jgi:hypothetical protein
MDDLSVDRNGSRRAASPPTRQRAAVVSLEAEHRFKFGPRARILGVTRMGENRPRQDQQKASHSGIVEKRGLPEQQL